MRARELVPGDVVITGRGLVCPLGNSVAEALPGLRQGRSALAFDQEMADRGFRCQVSGRVRGLQPERYFTEEQMLSMSRTSLYSSIAALQAVAESGLGPEDLQREEAGVLIGTCQGSSEIMFRSAQNMQKFNSPRRGGAHLIDTTMASTCAANATVLLRTRGIGEAVSSACASGLHNVGYAYRLIRHGYQETVIAGAADEDGWETAAGFDSMRVLCADSNHDPPFASRPLDRSRSGFIPSGGAGAVVLETAARAAARGAAPLARIAGYWSSTDGSGDMVAPWGEGQARLMRRALADGGMAPADIDYVNLHGTSTPTGDVTEVQSTVAVLGEQGYLVSASKSQIGHALGGGGAIELVFTLMMIEHGFVAPSINIRELDPALELYRHLIATEAVDRPLRVAMTNSFGFGNTNACLLLERVEA